MYVIYLGIMACDLQIPRNKKSWTPILQYWFSLICGAWNYGPTRYRYSSMGSNHLWPLTGWWTWKIHGTEARNQTMPYMGHQPSLFLVFSHLLFLHSHGFVVGELAAGVHCCTAARYAHSSTGSLALARACGMTGKSPLRSYSKSFVFAWRVGGWNLPTIAPERFESCKTENLLLKFHKNSKSNIVVRSATTQCLMSARAVIVGTRTVTGGSGTGRNWCKATAVLQKLVMTTEEAKTWVPPGHSCRNKG